MEQPKAKGITAYRCSTTAENHKDKEPPTIEAIRRHPPRMVATRLSDDDSLSKIPRSASDNTTSTHCFSLLFPRKLQRILSDAERNAGEGWDKIISWLPNGEGFKIHNKKRFADEIMPKYFGSSKFRTFQRSLNLWGFRTPLSGPNQGVSSHPLFQLGAPDLCKNMKRIVRKGKKKNENLQEGGKSSDITITQSKCRQQGTSVGLASPIAPPALQPAFSPSIASNPYICGGSEGNDFASFDFSANQHHKEQISPNVFLQQARAEVEEALAAATTRQEAIHEQLRLSTSTPCSRSSNGTTPFTSPLPIAVLRESMIQPRSGNGSNEQRLYSIFAGATASSRPSSSTTTSSHVLDVAGSSGGPTSVQKRPPSFPLVAHFPPSSSSLNDNKAVTTTTSEGRNMTSLMVLPHHVSTNDAARVQQEQAWQYLVIDQAARMVLASWGHQFS